MQPRPRLALLAAMLASVGAGCLEESKGPGSINLPRP